MQSKLVPLYIRWPLLLCTCEMNHLIECICVHTWFYMYLYFPKISTCIFFCIITLLTHPFHLNPHLNLLIPPKQSLTCPYPTLTEAKVFCNTIWTISFFLRSPNIKWDPKPFVKNSFYIKCFRHQIQLLFHFISHGFHLQFIEAHHL